MHKTITFVYLNLCEYFHKKRLGSELINNQSSFDFGFASQLKFLATKNKTQVRHPDKSGISNALDFVMRGLIGKHHKFVTVYPAIYCWK